MITSLLKSCESHHSFFLLTKALHFLLFKRADFTTFLTPDVRERGIREKNYKMFSKVYKSNLLSGIQRRTMAFLPPVIHFIAVNWQPSILYIPLNMFSALTSFFQQLSPFQHCSQNDDKMHWMTWLRDYSRTDAFGWVRPKNWPNSRQKSLSLVALNDMQNHRHFLT